MAIKARISVRRFYARNQEMRGERCSLGRDALGCQKPSVPHKEQAQGSRKKESGNGRLSIHISLLNRGRPRRVHRRPICSFHSNALRKLLCAKLLLLDTLGSTYNLQPFLSS